MAAHKKWGWKYQKKVLWWWGQIWCLTGKAYTNSFTSYLSLSKNMRQNLVKVCTKESPYLISNLIPPTSVQYTSQLNKIFYILSCSTRACTFDIIFLHFKYTYFQTTASWWQKDRERHRTVIIIDDKCKSETCDEEESLPHH